MWRPQNTRILSSGITYYHQTFWMSSPILNPSRSIALTGKTSWSSPILCGKPFWGTRREISPGARAGGGLAADQLIHTRKHTYPSTGKHFLKQIHVLRCLTSPKGVELSKKYLYTRKLCHEPISASKFQFYIQWEVRSSGRRNLVLTADVIVIWPWS